MVAKLQRALVAFALLGVMAIWLLLGQTRWAAVAAIALFPCLYAGVLAIECALASRLNRQTRQFPATRWSWTCAWIRECATGAQVFFWRQPFFTNAEPDRMHPAELAGCRGVVFVHGLMCNRAFWAPWMARLKKSDHPYIAVNLEPAFAGIEEQIAPIDRAVAQMRQVTGMAPLVVCHSMGGLAVRSWLAAAPDRHAQVHHVVTIATPHSGTWLARLGHSKNIRQMRLQSPWMARLKALEANQPSASFTCWYSNTDNIVFPADNATLPGARNQLVEGAAHVCLAFKPAVIAQTLALLL